MKDKLLKRVLALLTKHKVDQETIDKVAADLGADKELEEGNSGEPKAPVSEPSDPKGEEGKGAGNGDPTPVSDPEPTDPEPKDPKGDDVPPAEQKPAEDPKPVEGKGLHEHGNPGTPNPEPKPVEESTPGEPNPPADPTPADPEPAPAPAIPEPNPELEAAKATIQELQGALQELTGKVDNIYEALAKGGMIEGGTGPKPVGVDNPSAPALEGDEETIEDITKRMNAKSRF